MEVSSGPRAKNALICSAGVAVTAGSLQYSTCTKMETPHLRFSRMLSLQQSISDRFARP